MDNNLSGCESLSVIHCECWVSCWPLICLCKLQLVMHFSNPDVLVDCGFEPADLKIYLCNRQG